MNQALRYFGSKWLAAPWIISHFRPHSVFVDVFGGSGAVTLNKHPSKIEIYNDINSELYNFFKVLRERPEELVHQMRLTPHSREEFDACFHHDQGDELERARRLLVRSKQGRSFSGEKIKRNTWRSVYGVSGSDGSLHTTNFALNIDDLVAMADRFRSVQIENMDAIELIDRVDSEHTQLYVDPPYLESTVGSGRYLDRIDEDYHVSLAVRLSMCKSHVVLSGYQNPIYDEILVGWEKDSRQATTMGINKNREKSLKTEQLWISPGTQIQPTLF